MDMKSAREAFMVMCCGNNIGSHDRFVAVTLEWLARRGAVTIELQNDDWVIRGNPGGYASVNNTLADALSGAVRAFQCINGFNQEDAAKVEEKDEIVSDLLKWLRSQQEAYRAIGSSHASGQYKAAADKIERLQEMILDKGAELASRLSRIAHNGVRHGKMRHDIGLLLLEAVRQAAEPKEE